MPERIPYYRPAAAPCPNGYETTRSRRGDKAFYKSGAWRRLRDEVLDEQPLCVRCLAEGRRVPAVDVHHVRPRKDFPELALERSNLEGLCKAHHNEERRQH